jgi:hypothetical protein
MITRAALVVSLQASLHDAAHPFGEDGAVYDRCITVALQAFTRLRPRREQLEVAWSFGSAGHDVPADTLAVALVQWSEADVARWRSGGNLAPPAPLQASISQGATGPKLRLAAPLHGRAPSAGTVCVTLHRPHVLRADDADTDTHTTIPDTDFDLLHLRAQAEALRELANRGVTKPVALRDGQSQGPRNGTPAALYERALHEWREAMVA